MTEHRAAFRFMYGLLSVLGVAAVCAFLGYVAFSATTDTTVQYVEKHDPPIDNKSSVADTRGRFYGTPAQVLNGSDLGFPDGSKCDVYELKDGVTLLCYQGG